MSGVNRRRETGPPRRAQDARKGTTVPELDFKRIEFSEKEIADARAYALRRLASGLFPDTDPDEIIGALGLRPDQNQWYYPKQEKADGGA